MKKYELPKHRVNGIERTILQDGTLIGNWEEVKGIKASEITHRDKDNEILNGLLYKGYEMKFGKVNENGEYYEPTAFDKFIKRYFVEQGLNMPVTLEHSWYPEDIVGRVIYLETNSVGFYFVVYVPSTCPKYEQVKWLTEQGLIQGFSKEGYLTDYEWEQDKNNKDEWFIHIKEIDVTRVSLVTTPANGLPFEQVKEIRNALAYANKLTDEHTENSVLKSLFSRK